MKRGKKNLEVDKREMNKKVLSYSLHGGHTVTHEEL